MVVFARHLPGLADSGAFAPCLGRCNSETKHNGVRGPREALAPGENRVCPAPTVTVVVAFVCAPATLQANTSSNDAKKTRMKYRAARFISPGNNFETTGYQVRLILRSLVRE
jgi:hypothetical protein